MKTNITLSLDIDKKQWLKDHGISPTELMSKTIDKLMKKEEHGKKPESGDRPNQRNEPE